MEISKVFYIFRPAAASLTKMYGWPIHTFFFLFLPFLTISKMSYIREKQQRGISGCCQTSRDPQKASDISATLYTSEHPLVFRQYSPSTIANIVTSSTYLMYLKPIHKNCILAISATSFRVQHATNDTSINSIDPDIYKDFKLMNLKKMDEIFLLDDD